MGNVPPPATRRRAHPTPPALQSDDGPGEDPDGQQRIIDLRDVPSRWPTMDGMVSPAPHAWRYRDDPGCLAAVDAFYRDVLWNTQLELDGVDWPGRGRRHGGAVSVSAALRDVARLWQLPSAEEPLLSANTARQERNARRRNRRSAALAPDLSGA